MNPNPVPCPWFHRHSQPARAPLLCSCCTHRAPGEHARPGSQQRTPTPTAQAAGPWATTALLLKTVPSNLQMHSSHLGNSKTHIPLLSLFSHKNDPKHTPGTRFIHQATTGSSKHTGRRCAAVPLKQQWTPTQEHSTGKHDRALEALGTRHTRVPSPVRLVCLCPLPRITGNSTQSFQ